MSSPLKPHRAAISWEGDTLRIVRDWLKPIREDFGVALGEMQEGRPAALPVRPMPSIASGVFELKDANEGKWYRMVYLAGVEETTTSCTASSRTLPRQRSATWPQLNSVGSRCNSACERRENMKSKQLTPCQSQTNVLNELGFTPSEALEIKVKAEIYRDLLLYIRDRNIPQQELGTLLGIHQPDVSNLLTGKIAKFSVGKLIKLAGKLNLGAQVKLTRPKSSKLSRIVGAARPHKYERLTSSL